MAEQTTSLSTPPPSPIEVAEKKDIQNKTLQGDGCGFIDGATSLAQSRTVY